MNLTLNKALIGLTALAITAAGINSAMADTAAKGKGKTFCKTQRTENKQHAEQQQQENKTFRGSLKGKTTAEKKAMIEQQRATQKSENKEFTATQRDEWVQKIQSNPNLTDAQKAEKVKAIQDKWTQADAHRATQQSENKDAVDQVTSDLNSR